jgi:hypothetical protein
MTNEKGRGKGENEKQIPFGNDNKEAMADAATSFSYI